MPKKRNHKFAIEQINASTPKSPSSAPGTSSRTVNERLAQLRAEQAPRATIEHRNDIAMLATAHSMPPSLRQILQMPETAPPLPNTRARRQRIINGRRAPPGPAAPESWLASSQHAPAHLRAQQRLNKSAQDMRDTPSNFGSIALLGDLHALPAPGSLVDQALKAMAMHWDQLVEYEQYNLCALPPFLKASLLSYLGRYGPKEGITSHDLKVLFLSDQEIPGATGSEEVSRLDLTGLLSQCFTVNDLRRFLSRNNQSELEFIQQLEGLWLGETDPSGSPPKNQSLSGNGKEKFVLDSWEEDDEDTSSPSLIAGITTSRFPNLTRLSLAHAGSYASWHQLLVVSPQLSTLTHLSLAYWPVPNETPNSQTSFITHNHATIPTGGTHLYSTLDDDWQDPANVLRRLSNNTYCLKWLDLEGCSDWLPALTWTKDDDYTPDRWLDRTFGRSSRAAMSSLFDDLQTPLVVCGPDWNGSWAQITYINVSQGVIPCDVPAIRSRPATVIASELLLWLRKQDSRRKSENIRNVSAKLRKDVFVPHWLERESQARGIASTIKIMRKSAGGAFCTFDHGWSAPVFSTDSTKKAVERE